MVCVDLILLCEVTFTAPVCLTEFNVQMDHLHVMAQKLREHLEATISSVFDQHGMCRQVCSTHKSSSNHHFLISW